MKIRSLPLYRRYPENALNFPLSLVFLVCLLSGCISTRATKIYQNSETGISLEKSGNWNAIFDSRSGAIYLITKKGIWQNGTARVEIFAGSCPDDSIKGSNSQQTPPQILRQDIKRLGTLYNLEEVNIIQEPKKVTVEGKDYEFTQAIVSVPTMSMPANSNRIQVGEPDPSKSQIIELFVISNSEDTILAFIYKGNNEGLNAQAESIIKSIKRKCPTPT